MRSTGYTTSTNAATGLILCSGARSTGGPDCGPVLDGEYSTSWGGAARSDQLRYDACTAGGDSGAPVSRETGHYGDGTVTQYGIHAAGTGCSSTSFGVAGYVGHIRNILPLKLATYGVHGW